MWISQQGLWLHQSREERESTGNTKATTLCNLIIKVSCLPHCYSLLVRGKLIKAGEVSHGHEYQKMGILLGHLRSCLPHLPKSLSRRQNSHPQLDSPMTV